MNFIKVSGLIAQAQCLANWGDSSILLQVTLNYLSTLKYTLRSLRYMWVGLLTDRINNKLEKSILINEHALYRETVPLRWTQQVGLLQMYGFSWLNWCVSTAALTHRLRVRIQLMSRNFFRVNLQLLKIAITTAMIVSSFKKENALFSSEHVRGSSKAEWTSKRSNLR